MTPRFQNILALVAGIIAGMIVNLATLLFGNFIYPLPGDVNVLNPASIDAARHLFQTADWVFAYSCNLFGMAAASLFVLCLMVKPTFVQQVALAYVVPATVVGTYWTHVWRG